jgi:hypothetical protein
MKRSQTLAAAASAAFLSTAGLAEAAEAPVQGPVAYATQQDPRDKNTRDQFRLRADPPFTVSPYVMPREKGVILRWQPPEESDVSLVIGKHKRIKGDEERVFPEIRDNMPSGSGTSYGARLTFKF